jgi:type IV secretory pathway VirJ component
MMNETSEDIFDLVSSSPNAISPGEDEEMTPQETLILAILESETAVNNQHNTESSRPSLVNITNTLNLNQIRVPTQTPTICEPANRLQRFPLSASYSTASNQATSSLQATGSTRATTSNQATASLQASAQSTPSLTKTASKRPLLLNLADEHENQPPIKKKGGGRPLGSKNKKTIARESAAAANI